MNPKTTSFITELLGKIRADDWTFSDTPKSIDFASTTGERKSATIFEGTVPVATFWSYLMDGPANAEFVVWFANNSKSILDHSLSESEVETGLELFAKVRFLDMFPGHTPFYLRGNDFETITLRSPQHTEEVATVWSPDAETNAQAIIWMVSCAADLLAANIEKDPIRNILSFVVRKMQEKRKVIFEEDFIDDAEALYRKIADEGKADVPLTGTILSIIHAWDRSMIGDVVSLKGTPE